MIPPEMREKTPFANLPLASLCKMLSNLLVTAPVEDWKEAAVKLSTGQGRDLGFGRSPAVQRYAAQQIAILAFAADELSKMLENVGPDVMVDMLMAALGKEKDS